MTTPILILAVGNESRGDDALAPLLLRRLSAWLPEKLATQFELIEEFQLQVEHAADMLGRERVLFIDAGMDTHDPYTFYRVHSSGDRPIFSHALKPEDVLATYAQVYEKASPPAYVLCIRGDRFELGEVLSPEAAQRMELAFTFMQTLLKKTTLAAWEDYACADTRVELN